MRKPSAPHPPTAWATPHSGVLPTPQVGRDQLPLSHKPTASVREPLPSMTEATSMAIPGTLHLGNIRVYLITHLCSFAVIQNLTQNLGINRLQTNTEGLEDYFLMFTLHSRLRWVCRKLPTAAGEARKQLWHSAQTSASRADIG